MKIDFILQSDFPKDSDMVESFECQQTQTNRCVKKAKKIVFNHMQVSMQRIKNVCLKLANSEVLWLHMRPKFGSLYYGLTKL